jgi:alanine racemase
MDPSTPRRRALDHLIRPTRAEIDLGALRQNFAEARRLAGPAEVLAVVKANAYGHGAVAVARALEGEGAQLLGVALVEEGLELRNAGVRAPMLVLGGSYEGGYVQLVVHELAATVFRPEHVTELEAAARATGKIAAVHMKVDTGMGRIGIAPSQVDSFLDAILASPHLRLEGALSHFASADVADAPLTRKQVDVFKAVLGRMRARGVNPRWRHLSNSAGLIDLPEARDGLELNLVRPGLMLYGMTPAPGLSAAVRPVMTWKTAITHVKQVSAGTPISYGSTWTAARDSVIATLPVGYADGYSRLYSSRAPVLVRGQRATVVGRVCMDMCMIDVTDVPGAQVGDEVVLLGAQGKDRVTAEELAGLSQTISYEVVCAVGARVPRVTVQG